MSLLRHALGEDAQHARYLHTLYGVGYRFNLPAAMPVVAAAAISTVPTEAVHTTDGTVAPRSPLVGYQRRANDRLPPPSPRRWHPLLWMVPLLAVLAFAGWRAWPRSESASAPPAARAITAMPTLVVMPLKPIGDAASVRTIADGLSEELLGGLAQIEGLRVIARESTLIAAAESRDPAALAKRLGITHVLEGSLQQTGQALRVRLRLVDAGNGGALWARDFDRDATEVLALQRDIAQAVAASLTLKLGLEDAPKKSGDAEFLRRLLAAKALAANIDVPAEISTDPAEIEFRALLRERPDDARVHAGLAQALETRAFRRPELGAALREESLQEARLALQLDPSLPEPHYLLAADDYRHDRWEAALAGFARLRAVAPSRLDGYLSTAWTLARLGYLDRAEALYRDAKARDPINTTVDFFLARLLDTEGRHDEARVLLAKIGPRAVYARWFNAMLRHDAAAALREAEAYDAPNASDNYGIKLKPSSVLTARALADPTLWPQATASMRQYERENGGRMSFGLVFAPDAPAHAPELIAGLAEARRRAYSSYDLLLWTRDLAFLRRDPAFQDYLRDSGILAYWRRHGFPKQCRPQGEGAYCE
jgi:TolB-like protein